MSDLRELVRSLAGPLRLEASKGYPDAAVIGQSIGDYARGWAQRASKLLGDEKGREAVREIEEILSDYGRHEAAKRKQRVAQAQRLLGRLGPSQEDSPSSPPTPPGRRGGRKRDASSKPPPASPPRPRTLAPEAPAVREGPRPAGSAGRRQAPAQQLDERLAEGRLKNAAWVKRLAKLGIETKRDLLYHFPRDYSPVKTIAELADGERAAVLVTAGRREEAAVRERRSFRLMRYALEVLDSTGKAWVTSFARVPRRGARAQAILGSPLTLNYQEGALLLIEGAVKRAGRFIEIQHGSSEKLVEGETVAPGALVPAYPLTDGVYQGQVRTVVRRLLRELPADLPDPLPESLRRRRSLTGLSEALRDIHWPLSPQAQAAAEKRLAFEELLTLQVALAQRKKEMQRPGSGISMKPRGDPVAALEEILPFSLTRAQQRAIAEIAADMAADTPMSRMVQGDVGSGKTVVAAAALLIALQSGYQGALMAPTELLAEQHYLVLSHMLEPLGVEVQLLTGSLRGREREHAYTYIADGRAQVVVGTHALIQEGVEFHRLGLVVVDEQHRFGVRQRAELRSKGRRPDLLVMTATPIPRSLALTLYGDLDMSVLDEMPPGRTPVATRWLQFEQIAEAYEFVRREVAHGRQAYVVCPLVEESEKLQAEAATKLAEELQREVFPDLGVGLVHGAMSVAEKDAAMQAFRAGENAILCATTVIEVGVDVPNATVMLILNAERFGLAQLHQLRGRVGRGAHEAHCLLLTDRKYHPLGRVAAAVEELSQARERLKVLLDTADGFAIAERDLLLRGPGEFYGTRQHGLPDFRLARLARDVGVMEQARETAAWLIAQDPQLAGPEQAALRDQVAALRARMERTAG